MDRISFLIFITRERKQREMKQCKKCGTILNDTGKFCPNCGEKIEEQTEKSPKKIKPNWKKRGIFITVISVLTVAVAGGVAWTIRNHKTENRKADDVGKEKVVGKKKRKMRFMHSRTRGNGDLSMRIRNGLLILNMSMLTIL